MGQFGAAVRPQGVPDRAPADAPPQGPGGRRPRRDRVTLPEIRYPGGAARGRRASQTRPSTPTGTRAAITTTSRPPSGRPPVVETGRAAGTTPPEGATGLPTRPNPDGSGRMNPSPVAAHRPLRHRAGRPRPSGVPGPRSDRRPPRRSSPPTATSAGTTTYASKCPSTAAGTDPSTRRSPFDVEMSVISNSSPVPRSPRTSIDPPAGCAPRRAGDHHLPWAATGEADHSSRMADTPSEAVPTARDM